MIQPTPINVNLPMFFSHDPDAWFLFIENTFASLRIASPQEMFQHAVRALPHELIPDIKDLLRDAFTLPNPFNSLKERLTGRYGQTELQLLKKLLVDGIELGQRRPSALLAEMLTCLPAGEPFGKVMRALFIFRLPPYIQQQLHSYPTTSPAELAAAADNIYNAAVFATTTPGAQANNFNMVNNVSNSHFNRSQSSRSRSRDSRPRSRSNSRGQIGRAHV